MNIENSKSSNDALKEEKPFFKVIIHSFFIIPFLIAVFCVLLFSSIHLLTSEKRSVYDYLEDVKTGGLTKRWQGAFELSKMLANPQHLPKEDRFANELISAFEQSTHDDNRIRQYLALAMGRTGDTRYKDTLVKSLSGEKEENLAAIIYALGMLKQQDTAAAIYPFVEHSNERIRSLAIVALGNLANPQSVTVLHKGLYDTQENVRWGAAISLAQLGDYSGKEIILQLLNREYLSKFSEVDPYEQNQLILTAIDSAKAAGDPQLMARVKELSQSDPNMNVRSKALKAIE